MTEVSKAYKNLRVLVLAIVLVIGIVVAGIYSNIYSNSNIVKSNLLVNLNADTEFIFEKQFDNKKAFNKYYDYQIVNDSKTSDFILTSDVSQINLLNDYTVEGYSPLIICLKDSDNAKNYLKTNTKNGFLTCNDGAKKIKNSSNDSITCDFLRIINVVLKNGDWSDLGGEDKKITIYCPDPDSVDGKLFYEFLLITLNGGKYPKENLEEISLKAQKFLDSPNTVQTDVSSKIAKLGEEVEENDIYILFEEDFLKVANDYAKILVAYPELTVIKQIYMQFNNSELKGKITDIFEKGGMDYDSLSLDIWQELYYRTESRPDFTTQNGKTTSFNVQNGFNYYELIN